MEVIIYENSWDLYNNSSEIDGNAPKLQNGKSQKIVLYGIIRRNYKKNIPTLKKKWGYIRHTDIDLAGFVVIPKTQTQSM